jgi:uncharacterized protein YxeA
MSKRTIIIFAIAVLAIIAGAASMYFENKKLVDDANDIINGPDEPKQKPEPKPKQKSAPVITDLKEDENGIHREQN